MVEAQVGTCAIALTVREAWFPRVAGFSGAAVEVRAQIQGDRYFDSKMVPRVVSMHAGTATPIPVRIVPYELSIIGLYKVFLLSYPHPGELVPHSRPHGHHTTMHPGGEGVFMSF